MLLIKCLLRSVESKVHMNPCQKITCRANSSSATYKNYTGSHSALPGSLLKQTPSSSSTTWRLFLPQPSLLISPALIKTPTEIPCPWLAEAQHTWSLPLNYGGLPIIWRVPQHLLTSASSPASPGKMTSCPCPGEHCSILQYGCVLQPGHPQPGLLGGTTGRTHQCFQAIYFQELRAGGSRSSTEKPAEVPLAAKHRLGVSLSKAPFGRRGRRWFLMAGRKEPATWDLCIYAQKAANTTSMNMHTTKIIPHSRLSSDFNPGTHQLLSISRLRWFFNPWCPPAWHRNPNIALCSPTPRLTCTVPVSSTPRSRLDAFILTAQNSQKKKKRSVGGEK